MRKIVIDIETVPRPGIMDTWYPEWAATHNKGETPEEQEHAAGLYPEFGMVCAVCARDYEGSEFSSYADSPEKEKELLTNLAAFLDFASNTILIGHNIKGFDIPFLAKRYLAHGMKIPCCLQVVGKKPWEIPHFDTMEAMKFGGFTPMSLRSAALMLGLEDCKAILSGNEVWNLFKVGGFSEILSYCWGDVNTTGLLYEAIVSACK